MDSGNCLKIVSFGTFYCVFFISVVLLKLSISFVGFTVQSILHLEHVGGPCLVVIRKALEILLMKLVHQGASFSFIFI